jgi:hypothetical protein
MTVFKKKRKKKKEICVNANSFQVNCSQLGKKIMSKASLFIFTPSLTLPTDTHALLSSTTTLLLPFTRHTNSKILVPQTGLEPQTFRIGVGRATTASLALSTLLNDYLFYKSNVCRP